MGMSEYTSGWLSPVVHDWLCRGETAMWSVLWALQPLGFDGQPDGPPCPQDRDEPLIVPLLATRVVLSRRLLQASSYRFVPGLDAAMPTGAAALPLTRAQRTVACP